MAEQRTALVTGGAKRVGRAIVETLARAGWDVAFTFRSSQKEALQLQATLASATCRVLPLNADFDRLDQSIAMVRERFIRWSPRIDLLVNSAAAFAPDTRLSADAAMRANFVAPRRLIDTFASELRAVQGCVVNLLDILAERPMPSFSNYCASKAALWNATLSDARRLAPDVRVNGIAPGVVEWHESTDDATRTAYLSKVPLQRVGTPNDIAKAVLFLANDALFMTGQVLRIDGGRSIMP